VLPILSLLGATETLIHMLVSHINKCW
jgi:hypothetical protein